MKLRCINKRNWHYLLAGIAFDRRSNPIGVLDASLNSMDMLTNVPSRLIDANAKNSIPSAPVRGLGYGLMFDLQVHGNDQNTLTQCPVVDTKEDRPPCVRIFLQSISIDITMIIEIPLRYLLKGLPDLTGTYTVYSHNLLRGEKPEGGYKLEQKYYGITRRGWNLRFGEHMKGALGGSLLLFPREVHAAIQARTTILTQHHEPETLPLDGLISVIHGAGLTEDAAMDAEEYLVDKYSLASKHPGIGLNMIPGGRAGITALHTLRAVPEGLMASPDTEQRDEMLEAHMQKHPRLGQPNEAVAAAWEDSAYAEAVICGRENRLSGDQVREIRFLAAMGNKEADIVNLVGANNIEQVRRVLVGRTYGRIH